MGSDRRQSRTGLGNELFASLLYVRLPVLRHGEAMAGFVRGEGECLYTHDIATDDL